MASHRHFPKMGGIHFPYWLPGRDPVQLEIIRFKAGFFLLFCCDESDAFLSNYTIFLNVRLIKLNYTSVLHQILKVKMAIHHVEYGVIHH